MVYENWMSSVVAVKLQPFEAELILNLHEYVRSKLPSLCSVVLATFLKSVHGMSTNKPLTKATQGNLLGRTAWQASIRVPTVQAIMVQINSDVV